MEPPMPKWPERKIKKVKPEAKPSQADKDDLEIAAWSIGEYGTKEQVQRAYNAVWAILKEIRD